MKKIEYPLRIVVAEASKSKAYPKDVKKYLYGLFATLHLSNNVDDIEKAIYYAYRNGYVLGAASQGANDQEVQDRLPDLGMEEFGDDAKR